MSRLSSILLALVAILAASCSYDRPVTPSGGETRFLAGGGRQAGDDAFTGGPGDSGPGQPGFEPPAGDLYPLLYADIDCREDASEFVITNADDWQAWWTDAIACLGRDGEVYPDTIYNPYPEEAPQVDFATATVFVVALEPDDLPGRGVWIQDVTDDHVHYVVSHLGDDCFGEIMPMDTRSSSPTIAVVGPLVASPDQVTWEREDVTYDCSWEPDPNEPLALYYTDAACDLGPEHAIITDAETFEAWLTTALDCDQARWYGPDGPTTPPPVPSPGWLGLQVDFTTHAVIVLRGDEQDRWGGGVWLAAIATDADGTTIDYTVMAAGEDCPLVEGGTTVCPTVAIRVPLPLDEPVTWRRSSETIACDWGGDGVPWTRRL